MKNKHLPDWTIAYIDHHPQTIFPILVAFNLILKQFETVYNV